MKDHFDFDEKNEDVSFNKLNDLKSCPFSYLNETLIAKHFHKNYRIHATQLHVSSFSQKKRKIKIKCNTINKTLWHNKLRNS